MINFCLHDIFFSFNKYPLRVYYVHDDNRCWLGKRDTGNHPNSILYLKNRLIIDFVNILLKHKYIVLFLQSWCGELFLSLEVYILLGKVDLDRNSLPYSSAVIYHDKSQNCLMNK